MVRIDFAFCASTFKSTGCTLRIPRSKNSRIKPLEWSIPQICVSASLRSTIAKLVPRSQAYQQWSTRYAFSLLDCNYRRTALTYSKLPSFVNPQITPKMAGQRFEKFTLFPRLPTELQFKIWYVMQIVPTYVLPY